MKIGHFGTPSLVAFIAALALFIIQLAVPFGIVDHPTAANDVGLDDDVVSAGDVSADFQNDRYNLPNPDVAFTGLLLALVAGLLLLLLGPVPMGVNPARFTGWFLALVGATGAWLTLASSAYWLGTGFATLLGIISSNPHEASRFWAISPVLATLGGGFLLWTFLRVATNVVSTRDGLRDDARRHARVPLLAAAFLVAVLVVPWSFQLIDGDERRDNNECGGAQVCEGRLDWYTAWGTSADATFAPLQGDLEGVGFGSGAETVTGGILGIAANSDKLDFPLFQHAALSLKVLTAAAWTTFFTGTLATLGHVITSASKRDARATALTHLAGLALAAWASVHFLLLGAYQWRPSYDEALVPDAQSWWFGFLPIAAAPLLVWLVVAQIRLVRPLFTGITKVAKEKAQAAHSFD